MAELLEEDLEEDTQKGRFLTFLIGRETYGIEIIYVTEIIGIQKITEMPEMPDYLKGIINLRGKIIPVMDVRLRFSKQPREYDDRTCVIVIDLDGISIGLIVDSVSEVLSIPAQEICELPGISAGQSGGYVKNIGKANGGVILLIDSGKLVSAEALEQFDPETLTA